MVKRPRKKQRIRNPPQTRAKLLRATVDLIAEKGIDSLSLKEAARVANVSRGVAYQHFADRDHLLSEAKRWVSDRLMESAVNANSASMEDSVARVARLVLNNIEASKLLVADALAGRNFAADHPLYRQMLELLEEFKSSGKAHKDMDVEIMTFIMLGSVATIIMLSRLSTPGANDELARRFTKEWSRLLRQGIFRGVPRQRSRAAKQRSS